MVSCVVCSDDRNTAAWHTKIPSDHQSKISCPSRNFHVITSNVAKRKKKRRNITTTGKHNMQTRRGQTRRGKDGSLGTIFNLKILKDCWESPGAAQTCFLFTPASFCFSQLASWLDTFRSRSLFMESWLRSRQLSPHTKIFGSKYWTGLLFTIDEPDLFQSQSVGQIHS